MKSKNKQVGNIFTGHQLKKIFSRILKRSRLNRFFNKGFTLIELLVSMLIAALIVSVMLTFLVGVLESDRKEQAKSDAQEEVQAALNYIADDMQEALYIYDATSLAAINTQLPHMDGNANEATDPYDRCSEATKCTPVLVFWKRYVDPQETVSTPSRADNFRFSLVAYYLKSDVGATSTTWSNTARILRWELKDGYRWSSYCGSVKTAPCDTTTAALKRTPVISSNSAIIPPITDDEDYYIRPDQGFKRPDFNKSGTPSKNASEWRKFTANYKFTDASPVVEPAANKFTTLIDLIDDTDYSKTKYGTNNPTASINVSIGDNSAVTPFGNINCADPTNGVGVYSSADPTVPAIAQRVPSSFSDATANPSQLTSFYACVANTPSSTSNPGQETAARIYIRGNALARINPQGSRTPTSNNLPFFPSINTRVSGRSTLGLGKQQQIILYH